MAVAPRLRKPPLRVPSSSSNGKLRVLVVDDEVAFGNVMREVLDSFGMDVRVAVGATQALTEMRGGGAPTPCWPAGGGRGALAAVARPSGRHGPWGSDRLGGQRAGLWNNRSGLPGCGPTGGGAPRA